MIDFPDNLKNWIEIVKNLLAILAGLIAAIWAYTKFFVERGLLPGVQFNIELGTVGTQDEKYIVELLVHLNNVGPSTLVAKNLSIEVCCMDADDYPGLFWIKDKKVGNDPKLFDNEKKHLCGRVNFENKLFVDLPKELWGNESEKEDQDGIPIIKHETFVQPGVDQVYTFATAVPNTTTYIRVCSSFLYKPRHSLLQRIIIFVTRPTGLIKHSLKNIKKPHTCERIFKL